MLKVRRVLDVSEVKWSRITKQVAVLQKVSESEASLQVWDFARRMTTPLHPYWYLYPRLSKRDNGVVTALCQQFGCDELTLKYQESFSHGLVKVRYVHSLELTPDLGQGRDGRSNPCYQVVIFGCTLTLNTVLNLILFELFLFCLLLLLFLLGTLLMIHGAAILYIFMREPGAVTLLALHEPSVGTALVCVLTGLAGLGGVVIRWIGARASRRRQLLSRPTFTTAL